MTAQDATGATQSDEQGAQAPKGQAPHERRSGHEHGQLFDPTPYAVTPHDPDRHVTPGMGQDARRTTQRRALNEDGTHPATRLPTTSSVDRGDRVTPQGATGAMQSDERGAQAPKGQAPRERHSEREMEEKR